MLQSLVQVLIILSFCQFHLRYGSLLGYPVVRSSSFLSCLFCSAYEEEERKLKKTKGKFDDCPIGRFV